MGETVQTYSSSFSFGPGEGAGRLICTPDPPLEAAAGGEWDLMTPQAEPNSPVINMTGGGHSWSRTADGREEKIRAGELSQ